eukprot:3959602-Ditylum_brightwellii.AAC.1
MTEMEEKATKLDKWHLNFDAEQKKQFCEQDRKITKKLDAQTMSIDSKINKLAISMQKQISTNQLDIQQMM